VTRRRLSFVECQVLTTQHAKVTELCNRSTKHSMQAHKHKYKHTQAHTQAQTQTQAHTSTYTHTNTRTHAHKVRTHTYAHTNSHTHAHTQTHTHTQIHTCKQQAAWFALRLYPYEGMYSRLRAASVALHYTVPTGMQQQQPRRKGGQQSAVRKRE
jgi:hypothetical protein